MKALLAKLVVAALVSAPLSAPAQNHLRPADPRGQLTLLPGPKFLSPAGATGEVVPGQMWSLKKTGDITRLFTTGSGGGYLTLGGYSGSTSLAPAYGTLTFRRTGEAPKENENFVRRLKPAVVPVDPALLRFDTTLPKTEIRPLQKKPAPVPAAPAEIKSL